MQVGRLIAAATMCVAACFGNSAAIARFLQVDPVGYKDQVNLYAYVNNDPMNGSDRPEPPAPRHNRTEKPSTPVASTALRLLTKRA